MDKQSLAIRTRQWYKIVLEANSSSLSKKEWCKQNSISPKSFYNWQRKFRQTESEKRLEITPSVPARLEEKRSTHLLLKYLCMLWIHRIGYTIPDQESSLNLLCRKEHISC